MEHISDALQTATDKIVAQLHDKLRRQEQAVETTKAHIQLMTAKQGDLFGTPKKK